MQRVAYTLHLLLLLQATLALLIDPSVDCFVSTFAGYASATFADGDGSAARFFFPRGIAVGPTGTAYVADRSNNRVRGILPNGTVFTLGGNQSGMFSDGGAPSSAFFNPIGIAASPFQLVYVADFGNNRVRAIHTASRVATTLVGTGASASVDGVGAVSAASRSPTGAAMGYNSTQLFFTDSVGGAAVLRVVALASGAVKTLGRGLTLTNGGGGCSGGITQLANLSVLVADTGNHRIALLLANGSFVTFAGVLGAPGHGDGPRPNVSFNFPTDVRLDRDGSLLVLDAGNNALRRVLPDGSAVTLAGGSPAGFADFAFGGAAQFSSPCGVALTPQDGVYLVSDTGNHRIRRVQCSARVAYNVSTLAGGGASGLTPGSLDGVGTAALFQDPAAIALSGSNGDYALVVDMSNSRLRRVSAKCRTVTTLAGGGASGFAVGSANGAGSAALFYGPRGAAAAPLGAFFISDSANHRVRFVTPLGGASNSAGNGSLGARDGAVASGSTTLSSPRGLAYDDATGSLFIADLGNNKVRALRVANGTLDSLVGGGPSGAAPGAVDGVGTAALLNTPVSLSLLRGAAAPLLYILEYNAHRVRVLNLDTLATMVLAGGGGHGPAAGVFRQPGHGRAVQVPLGPGGPAGRGGGGGGHGELLHPPGDALGRGDHARGQPDPLQQRGGGHRGRALCAARGRGSDGEGGGAGGGQRRGVAARHPHAPGAQRRRPGLPLHGPPLRGHQLHHGPAHRERQHARVGLRAVAGVRGPPRVLGHRGRERHLHQDERGGGLLCCNDKPIHQQWRAVPALPGPRPRIPRRARAL